MGVSVGRGTGVSVGGGTVAVGGSGVREGTTGEILVGAALVKDGVRVGAVVIFGAGVWVKIGRLVAVELGPDVGEGPVVALGCSVGNMIGVEVGTAWRVDAINGVTVGTGVLRISTRVGIGL
jgi:hypothetical protein